MDKRLFEVTDQYDGALGQYAALAQCLSSFVAVCDGWIVRYINDAGANLLESTPSELIGASLTDFLHSDYTDFAEFGLEIFAEEDGAVPLKFVSVAGNVVDVRMTVRPFAALGRNICVVEVHDITDFVRASEAVREREQRLQGILNSVSETIFTFVESGEVKSFNPAAEQTFGYKAHEIIGEGIEKLLPKGGDQFVRRVLHLGRKGRRGGLSGKLWEIDAQTKDNKTFPVEFTVAEVPSAGNRIYSVVLRDITERKRIERHMRQLAHEDSLTGLPNRLTFNQRLDHALQLAKRNSRSLALLFIDLDRFKPINDTFGHEAGDVVLKTVAERMGKVVREVDTLARLGGDEFVVILEEVPSADRALFVGQKLLDAVCEPIMVMGNDCSLSASIGVALYPEHGDCKKTLVRAADEAMYRAKELGRAGVVFYTKDQA